MVRIDSLTTGEKSHLLHNLITNLFNSRPDDPMVCPRCGDVSLIVLRPPKDNVTEAVLCCQRCYLTIR